MPEKYVWKYPDPTVSELRRFVERDFGKYLVNALCDVGTTLGFMGFLVDCPPIAEWLKQAEKLMTIPERIKEALLHIDEARLRASFMFPSLNRIEIEAAKGAISIVIEWLRNEFPDAGVNLLPDDFGR